jgi:hypothetical protein
MSFKLWGALEITLSISTTPAISGRLSKIARWAGFSVLWLLTIVLLLSREPYHLLDPQLWAEDGAVWIYDDYTNGLAALWSAHTGYLQTFPRLIGFSSFIVPIGWVPEIFAVFGLLTQLLPAWLLLLPAGRELLPSWPARFLMIAFYLGVPNSFETFLNITNAQWHIAIIMFLLIEMRIPRTLIMRRIQNVCLVIGGLSGPFCFFLAPIVWWQVMRAGAAWRSRAVQAVLLTLTAVIQAGYAISTVGTARHLEPLGASFVGLAQIIVGQVFLAALVGAGNLSRIQHMGFWQSPFCLEALLVLFLALLFVAVAKGPPVFRHFVLLAALILIAALGSPVGSTTQPQWDALEVPGAGSRYYLLPILAWFAGLLVLAAAKNQIWRWGARVLILVSLIGVRADWHYGREPETGFAAAAAIFEAAPPGTSVSFREEPNPAVWIFSLTKR